MTPRRVAFVNPVGGLGGAEQSLLRILRALRNHAPDIDCSLLAGSDGPLLEMAGALGVAVERFPLADAARALGDSGLRRGGVAARARFLAAMPQAALDARRAARWLGDWFERRRPDLIHSNGLKAHLLTAVSRPAGTALIWHIRDFLGQRPLMRGTLRWFAPRATMALANSNAVAADARRLLGRLPVRTLYNIVDAAHFEIAELRPESLDEAAKLTPAPPGTLRIGLVATYANWKGHDVLLKAAARLPKDLPFRVYLVGDPIYATPGSQFSRAELESLAARLGLSGSVGFVPFQTDTAAVYRNLDIVVHASTRPEPFGLTIAEAMAGGRAVVIAAAGGARELFTDGVDALGHEPGQVESLKNALERLCADPELRRRLGQQARATALSRFTEEPFARRLLALYGEACKGFLPSL